MVITWHCSLTDSTKHREQLIKLNLNEEFKIVNCLKKSFKWRIIFTRCPKSHIRNFSNLRKVHLKHSGIFYLLIKNYKLNNNYQSLQPNFISTWEMPAKELSYSLNLSQYNSAFDSALSESKLIWFICVNLYLCRSLAQWKIWLRVWWHRWDVSAAASPTPSWGNSPSHWTHWRTLGTVAGMSHRWCN